MVILLTAPSGIGKSTLLLKLISQEGFEKSIGFITTEILISNKTRIGFTMTNIKTKESGTIAHKQTTNNKFKVGDYYVNVAQILQVIKDIQVDKSSILIIDEIGGLQTISSDFKQFVRKNINVAKFCIATITCDTEVQLANELKQNPEFLLLNLTIDNRVWLMKVLAHLKSRSFEYDSISLEKRLEFNKKLADYLKRPDSKFESALLKINEMLFFMK